MRRAAAALLAAVLAGSPACERPAPAGGGDSGGIGGDAPPVAASEPAAPLDEPLARLVEILGDASAAPERRVQAAVELGKAEKTSGTIDDALLRVARDPAVPAPVRMAATRARASRKGVHLPAAGSAPMEPKVEIELPAGPPDPSPVEPGGYLFSTRLVLAGGTVVEDRRPCTVAVDGGAISWTVEGEDGAVRGTLSAGSIEAGRTEEAGTFRLVGKTTAPGRMAGTITGEPKAGIPAIIDGRWSLEKRAEK